MQITQNIITKDMVARAVYEVIPRIACVLPDDVRHALERAREAECTSSLDGERASAPSRGAAVLDHLLENAAIAERDGVPLCQDTGTVWACLEVGPDVALAGDVFAEVNDAVARAYDEAHLRKSVVRDALFDRANTGDNTPAFTDVHFVDEPGARVHVLLKGGGSDNASRVTMLTPGAGREGVIDEIMDCVRHKAANACPPLVIGVGVGSTFDKVGSLAKSALMRPIGAPAANEQVAAFERELLARVNATGMGPGALGGGTLALAVHVNAAPCHIAALPLAINMGCSAMRRATVELFPDEVEGAQQGPGFRGAIASELSSAAYGILHPGEAAAREAVCAEPCRDGSWASSVVSGRSEKAACAAAASQAGCRAEGAQAQDASVAVADDSPSAASRPAAKRLALPLEKEALASLHAGEACTLTGEMYMLRDAGHMRLLAELEEQGALPYGLAGAAIFYAGPTPPAAGRPFGAVGPTTASRMDFAAPALHRAGIVATIGKGVRSSEVIAACKETGSVYFVATGGAAALLAQRVESGEVVAYDDLGTEALRRIVVRDFPVFVGVDTRGVNIYDL